MVHQTRSSKVIVNRFFRNQVVETRLTITVVTTELTTRRLLLIDPQTISQALASLTPVVIINP